MLSKVFSAYEEIEKSIDIKYNFDRVTYNAPVNFNESLLTCRHRWFPYKEGFSPSFVRAFFKEYILQEKFRILDPFSGVGTTVIEAAMAGCEGYGIEVNPLASFVAKTKATTLSEKDLQTLVDSMQEFKSSSLKSVAPYPEHKTVNSYFEEEYLEALLKVKHFYTSLPHGNIRNLFKLAFLSIVETFSTHRRAGNGVKRKSKLKYRELEGNALDNVKQFIGECLKLYIEDIKKIPIITKPEFMCNSSLEIKELEIKGKFNCVLTSPPYANCFDYSKIYLRELWLGDFFTSHESQKEFRKKSIRSHVHARWTKRYEEKGSRIMNDVIYPELKTRKMWSKQIPSMLKGYFMDLGQLFESLYPVMLPKSPVGLVVGNSAYGGIPIATDLLVAETAGFHGFDVECIEIYRHIIPSSQQYVKSKKKEYFRESMVVLRRI